MSSFDFLPDSVSTLVVGHWDGDVAVVDRRTPGTSAELSASLNSKATRTVHVHPVNRQFFVAAGSTYAVPHIIVIPTLCVLCCGFMLEHWELAINGICVGRGAIQ